MIKRFFNVFINLCLVVALIMFAAFTLPQFFGLDIYVVTSGSMEPKYPVGCLLYVKDVDPLKIEVGDSITFYMKDSKVIATHQVYEINYEEEFFRTQGINNLDRDGQIIKDASPVSFNSLIGKPVLSIPVLGYVNLACTRMPGNLILGGLILGLAAMAFFFKGDYKMP